MEKIILAIDAAYVDINTLEFACYIAGITHSKLTGMFLENTPEEVSSGLVYGDPFTGMVVAGGVPIDGPRAKLCEDNIRIFKEVCIKRNVSYTLHHDRNVPVSEIIDESRFADLLILDPKTFDAKGVAINGFVKKILVAAECPVIVVPEYFKEIDEIVFAYDGSASSVFAIKQFTYLFPELDDKKATLLQVNEAGNEVVDDKPKIAEWLKTHYSIINLMVLNGKTKDELFGYLAGKKDVMVVMGAFGRSAISQLFRSSSAEPIIKAVNLPVFITHH